MIHTWVRGCFRNIEELVCGYAYYRFTLCIDFDVFLLSFRFRMATIHVGDSYLSEGDVQDIIGAEVSRFMREFMLGWICTDIHELTVNMDERLGVLWVDLEVV